MTTGDLTPISSDYLRPARRGARGEATIDLNCDVGEGVGNEARLLSYVSSCSVACGGHAGDAVTLRRVLNLGMQHQLGVGAHPGYEDREHMGRRSLKLTAKEVKATMLRQLNLFKDTLLSLGGHWQHVKLHGALYHDAAEKKTVAKAVIEAMQEVCPRAYLFNQPLGNLYTMAQEVGFRVVPEYFADRAYQPDGKLVPRNQKDALITERDKVVENVTRMTREFYAEMVAKHGPGAFARRAAKPAFSLAMFDVEEAEEEPPVTGGPLHPTFCVHGDTPEAVEIVRWLRIGLSRARIDVASYPLP